MQTYIQLLTFKIRAVTLVGLYEFVIPTERMNGPLLQSMERFSHLLLLSEEGTRERELE